MVKIITTFMMIVCGACLLLIPELREIGGNITGHIWIVGSIIVNWLPGK